MDSTLQLIGAIPISQSVNLNQNYISSYRGITEHFPDRLDTGAPFNTSLADNLETLNIIEKADAKD
jgi:hypothetical protein